MNNAPEHLDHAPSQPQEETPRYEKPTAEKIGNMSTNTKAKSVQT